MKIYKVHRKRLPRKHFLTKAYKCLRTDRSTITPLFVILYYIFITMFC